MAVPETGLLSNFDDPPENPLSEGGRWHYPFRGDKSFTGVTYLDMRKESGQATDQHHDATLSGIIAYSYWTPEQFSGDVEVWGYPVGGQLGAALETWRLFMWQDIENPTGYLMYIGGGIGKSTELRKYTNFTFSGLGSHGASYASAVMLRTKGSQVEVHAVDYGNDPMNPANWYQRIGVTDNSYRGPFWIGMGVEDPTAGGLGWTAFGGGKRYRTQFYRWMPSIVNPSS